MTDEVSESMRLGVLMVVAAALLCSVLSILVMALGLLNGFGSGIDTITNQGNEAQIISLADQPYVSGPIVYTAVLNSIDSIDVVIIVGNKKSDVTWNVAQGKVNEEASLIKDTSVGFAGYVYRLSGSGYSAIDKTSYLFTQCSNKFYKVHIQNGTLKSAYRTVILEEVDH